MTYKTISQRENIKDKDVVKILDYLERHCKETWILNIRWDYLDYTIWDFTFRMKKGIDAVKYVRVEVFHYSCRIQYVVLDTDIHILSENIVWIYASLRDYYLK